MPLTCLDAVVYVPSPFIQFPGQHKPLVALGQLALCVGVTVTERGLSDAVIEGIRLSDGVALGEMQPDPVSTSGKGHAQQAYAPPIPQPAFT